MYRLLNFNILYNIRLQTSSHKLLQLYYNNNNNNNNYNKLVLNIFIFIKFKKIRLII